MTDRYPLQPLATHLGIHLGTIGGQQPGQHPEGLHALALALGISHRHARRIHTHGLTDTAIDRYITGRLRIHPADIWPDLWWTNAPGEDDHWYTDDPAIDDLGPTRAAA
jgi:hypothetical protein